MTSHISHSTSIAQEVSWISITCCQVQRLLLPITHVHTKPRGTYLQLLAGVLQYNGREFIHTIIIHRDWRNHEILLHLDQLALV